MILSKNQDQETPLNMPKKTKLFVEQSQRERDQSQEIYRTYMKDLFKLRLKVSSNYVKTLKEGFSQGSTSGLHIRLHATVSSEKEFIRL